jgi:hypothetical protein
LTHWLANLSFFEKIQQTPMTTPTKDTLIQKLQGYGLSQVVAQIDPLSNEDLIAFVEKDWTDLGCSLAVAKAIYNHLHPSPKSSRSGSETDLSVIAPKRKRKKTERKTSITITGPVKSSWYAWLTRSFGRMNLFGVLPGMQPTQHDDVLVASEIVGLGLEFASSLPSQVQSFF